MIVQGGWQEVFTFGGQEDIVIEASAARLTQDAGLLPLRALDEQLGLTAAFAAALNDPRDPELLEHSVLQMVRQRVYGILADYEDQDDHDTLRFDPLFQLLVGRTPGGPPLASQPTLSRFENFVDITSLKKLRALLVDQFIASFATPPRRLLFDLDAVDDPAHGNQQLTFWHNYYDQNQYLPLIVTCANNELVVLASLRHGSAHAALGTPDDLEYLVKRVRAVWPDVVICARADAAFGIPAMMDPCERELVTYTFGLTANKVLQRRSNALLAQAVTTWAAERERARAEGRPALPVRLFEGFWYKAGTWPAPRFVVVKAEANEQGTNRRFVVTNRPGAAHYPQGSYEEYAERGESENRNKEIKLGCAMGRLSNHRFVANYFRLYLSVLALNLLVQFRQAVGVEEAGVAAAAAVGGEVPAEALAGQQRQRYFRWRRLEDVLGQAQPDTWRRLVIKVAAEVVMSAGRVLVRLSGCWPHLEEFQRMCQRLREHLAGGAHAST